MKWRNMTYAQRKKQLEIEAGTPYLYCPDCDVKIGLNTVLCPSCGCGNPSELAMKDLHLLTGIIKHCSEYLYRHIIQKKIYIG